MNYDRNISNLLGVSESSDSGITVFAIDFEKSATLRGQYPLIESAEIPPSSFWPKGLLGEKIKGKTCPSDFISKIQDISDEMVEESFASARDAIGDSFSWSGSSKHLLCNRKGKLPELVREVWK